MNDTKNLESIEFLKKVALMEKNNLSSCNITLYFVIRPELAKEFDNVSELVLSKVRMLDRSDASLGAKSVIDKTCLSSAYSRLSLPLPEICDPAFILADLSNMGFSHYRWYEGNAQSGNVVIRSMAVSHDPCLLAEIQEVLEGLAESWIITERTDVNHLNVVFRNVDSIKKKLDLDVVVNDLKATAQRSGDYNTETDYGRVVVKRVDNFISLLEYRISQLKSRECKMSTVISIKSESIAASTWPDIN